MDARYVVWHNIAFVSYNLVSLFPRVFGINAVVARRKILHWKLLMNEIIVALNEMDQDEALELARILTGKVWGFKVNDMILKYGCGIVHSLKKYGNVFADPKLHDIPSTVYNASKCLSRAGADLISCHISGGVKMLQAANQGAGKAKIIGVTMLTSMDFEDIRQTYRGWPLERFADIANNAKIHGVICAGHEIPFWNLFDNLIKIVSGVRPFGPVLNDDQVRSCQVATANYLVVGRPIVNDPNPIGVIAKIKAVYNGRIALPPLDEALNEIRM